MKQVLQDKKTGQIQVVDIPDARRAPGCLLVRVHASVISAGTEGAMVAAAGRTLLQRLADKPELLKKGVDTLRAGGIEGLKNQIESKYAGYGLLGYSCAGTVLESDPAAPGVAPGMRVACGGIGHASHAELVSVPRLLCAVVPDGVSDEAAAYTTLGAIAMQGVRQSGAVLGETVAVIGLGLVGLLASQLLKAAGCRVIGIDPSASARGRALEHGCAAACGPDEALVTVLETSRGIGADGVLICAATASSDPIALAGAIARSRGRVVMVGATGMEVPRETYFQKELSFLLSRSYGPGRYDPSYEEAGLDYPVDFVRFTEQRNMQAFLDLAAAGSLTVEKLTTQRFPVDRAPEAYQVLNDPSAERVGILLEYPHGETREETVRTEYRAAPERNGRGISFIGAGSYAAGALLPELRRNTTFTMRGVCTRQPAGAASAAVRFGFAYSASDPQEILDDEQTGIVFITTRHNSHADYAARALRAGKHVWVEKPLAMTGEELDDVEAAHREGGGLLAVGFNRRFSPLSARLLAALPSTGPVMVNYRVNAGHLPADHWTQDPAVGGGRLIGEGCHFLDYLCFVARSEPVSVYAAGLRSERPDLPAESNFHTTVSFRNGSVGHVVYAAEGAPGMSKERVEIFAGGMSAVLDDYRSLTLWRGGERKVESLKLQDKGQAAMLQAFLRSASAAAPFAMTAASVFTSSRLTLAARESLVTGRIVPIER